MTEVELVEVPFGDNPSDTAVLLLAAAEELDRDQTEVRTGSGVFLVPQEIADQAANGKPKKSRSRSKPEPDEQAQDEK